MHPDDLERFGPGRLAAAAAVRRLNHALAGRDAGDDELDALARSVDALAAGLEARPRRPPIEESRRPRPLVRDDGEELWCVGGCLVAGPGNPLSAGIAAHRDGEEAVVRVTLGDGFEGLPGRAHGGIVASLFDEVMGFALFMDGIPAYTAWLRVDYRAAVRVGVPLELRARVRHREGRKFTVEARLHDGEAPGPTAEALFVTPRPG